MEACVRYLLWEGGLLEAGGYGGVFIADGLGQVVDVEDVAGAVVCAVEELSELGAVGVGQVEVFPFGVVEVAAVVVGAADEDDDGLG